MAKWDFLNKNLPAVMLAAGIAIPSCAAGYSLKGCVTEESAEDYNRARDARMILPYSLQTYEHKGHPAVGHRKDGAQCVFWEDGSNKGADCYHGDHMVKIHGHGLQEFERQYSGPGRKSWTRVRQKNW